MSYNPPPPKNNPPITPVSLEDEDEYYLASAGPQSISVARELFSVPTSPFDSPPEEGETPLFWFFIEPSYHPMGSVLWAGGFSPVSLEIKAATQEEALAKAERALGPYVHEHNPEAKRVLHVRKVVSA